MLVTLGLGAVPVETIGSTLLVLMASSVIIGWIADAILGDVGPGLGACCVMCFIGMSAGLLSWGSFVPVRASDVVTMLWIAVGSAVAAILIFAALRRRVF